MAERLAVLIFLLMNLAWAPGLRADDDAAPLIFWLGAHPAAAFPSDLIEAKGLSVETIDLEPARCKAPEEPDPVLEERIQEGIDLFYSNDFGASESILRDVWLELGKGKDVLDIPPSWITECFVFRMLIFKATGMDSEAESLARRLAGQ
jgi:hypothetical protein